jgi:hypothetical protein
MSIASTSSSIIILISSLQYQVRRFEEYARSMIEFHNKGKNEFQLSTESHAEHRVPIDSIIK